MQTVCVEDCSLVLPGMPTQKWHDQTSPAEDQNGTGYTHVHSTVLRGQYDSNAASFYTGLCQLVDLAWPCQRGGLGQEVSGKQELNQEICHSASRSFNNNCQLTSACRADGQGKPGRVLSRRRQQHDKALHSGGRARSVLGD